MVSRHGRPRLPSVGEKEVSLQKIRSGIEFVPRLFGIVLRGGCLYGAWPRTVLILIEFKFSYQNYDLVVFCTCRILLEGLRFVENFPLRLRFALGASRCKSTLRYCQRKAAPSALPFDVLSTYKFFLVYKYSQIYIHKYAYMYTHEHTHTQVYTHTHKCTRTPTSMYVATSLLHCEVTSKYKCVFCI